MASPAAHFLDQMLHCNGEIRDRPGGDGILCLGSALRARALIRDYRAECAESSVGSEEPWGVLCTPTLELCDLKV